MSVVAAQLAAPGVPISPFWHVVWSVAHVLLPPFAIQNAVLAGGVGAMVWCAGYGVLALVVAALMIRGLEWGR
jgi:hypothetical protein